MVGIDAPDFNLPIERVLKRAGIPTVHYVSPTVWAWRRGRAKRIIASVNQLLCLFPFEPACYKGQPIEPVFIGHPLADEIPMEIDRAQQRRLLNLPEGAPLITLMPGSRQSELDFHAQLFVETANRIAAELPDAYFIVPLTTPATRDRFEAALQAFGATGLRLRILFGHAREALAASDLALVCSGTATLEAALLRCPMIITYRISSLSAWIYKKMRYLPGSVCQTFCLVVCWCLNCCKRTPRRSGYQRPCLISGVRPRVVPKWRANSAPSIRNCIRIRQSAQLTRFCPVFASVI